MRRGAHGKPLPFVGRVARKTRGVLVYFPLRIREHVYKNKEQCPLHATDHERGRGGRMLPSLQSLTLRAPEDAPEHAPEDIGVFDPIPEVLDSLLYSNEMSQKPVVLVRVPKWSANRQSLGVVFTGPGTAEERTSASLDLAAYVLEHLTLRYEFDGVPPFIPELTMHSLEGFLSSTFPLQEEHPHMEMVKARRFRRGMPLNMRTPKEYTKEKIVYKMMTFGATPSHYDLGGVEGPIFFVDYPSTTVDREYWNRQKLPDGSWRNGINLYYNARVYDFPHRARLLTNVIKQWVRDVYAPSIGHRGLLDTTDWSASTWVDEERPFGGDSDVWTVRLLSDMPVATKRARAARAVVRAAVAKAMARAAEAAEAMAVLTMAAEA